MLNYILFINRYHWQDVAVKKRDSSQGHGITWDKKGFLNMNTQVGLHNLINANEKPCLQSTMNMFIIDSSVYVNSYYCHREEMYKNFNCPRTFSRAWLYKYSRSFLIAPAMCRVPFVFNKIPSVHTAFNPNCKLIVK